MKCIVHLEFYEFLADYENFHIHQHIQEAEFVKFLGVILDENQSWKSHLCQL